MCRRQLKLRFVVLAGRPTWRQQGLLAQATLGQLGVDLDIVTVPSNDYFEDMPRAGQLQPHAVRLAGRRLPDLVIAIIDAAPRGMSIQQNYAASAHPRSTLTDRANATFDEPR